MSSGVVVCAKVNHWDVAKYVGSRKLALVLMDPPYGGIVKQRWDKLPLGSSHPVWELDNYIDPLRRLQPYCAPGAAAYAWGGVGKPHCRPFYKFLVYVEPNTDWQIAAHITWAKKRAYGVQHNYLFTREELAYLVLGDVKKPRVFNVPYLDKARGYPGYDKKYPAKDARLRRTMVWSDVTEILKGKIHECEKPERLYEIMIGTSTNPGDLVVDLFSGSGNASLVAQRMGRDWIAVENDEKLARDIADRLAAETPF
jgi:DNA modification methylase